MYRRIIAAVSWTSAVLPCQQFLIWISLGSVRVAHVGDHALAEIGPIQPGQHLVDARSGREGLVEGAAVARALAGDLRAQLPELLGAQHRRALDRVAQLARVAGPVVALERPERLALVDDPPRDAP